MWKKDEAQSGTQPAESPARPTAEAPPRNPGSPQRAAIGRSIRIRGEVSGDEDLLIQGEVDGSVALGKHQVTVGGDGRVKASITARLVIVEGRVEGDVTAEEQVILRASARVEGDMAAPRVVIEDGARFRGSVDMGDPVEGTGKDSGRQDARGSGKPGASSGTNDRSDTDTGTGPGSGSDAAQGSGSEAGKAAGSGSSASSGSSGAAGSSSTSSSSSSSSPSSPSSGGKDGTRSKGDARKPVAS
jgi:cytoskeletal protein CcmA (bactofilin family)